MGSQTVVQLWKAETEQIHNPFRYCGEYQDTETGLIYLRNRYYDNSIGRFITEDPIRDGSNWYVYCENNPVNFIDSLGLAPTPEESAEMNKQMYNFNRNSNLADIDISERTVSLSEGRSWEIHDLWVKGTVIMGVYQLVDGNGGYTELCAVFQGTSVIGDWVDNIDAYSDTFSPNLVIARNFGEGLVEYHTDVEITFSGHSKGGGEAIAAALHTARDAITFNAANFDFGNATYSWMMSHVISIKNYYVEWEILSLLIGYSSVGEVYLIPGSGSVMERHSINTVIEGFSKE